MINKSKLDASIEKCFSLIIGECSPVPEQIMKAEDDFAMIKNKSDAIELLKLIKRIYYKYQSYEYALLSRYEVLYRLSI